MPGHQTGVASGINNAVAAVASLVAVAIFGAVALQIFNSTLAEQLERPELSLEVKQRVADARGKFAVATAPTPARPEASLTADAVVKEALAAGIHRAMLLAVGLALASAACAAITLPPDAKQSAVIHGEA